MGLEHKKIAFSPLVIAAIFVSIFKYELAGSVPIAVGIGSLSITVGIVLVIDALIREISNVDAKIRKRVVLVGSAIISAPVYYIFHGSIPVAQNIREIYLTLLVITIAVSYMCGRNVAVSAADGLRHGFLTSGTASTFLLLLVFNKAISQTLFYGGLVAISSVILPIVLGAIGGIAGFLGALSNYQSNVKTKKSNT